MDLRCTACGRLEYHLRGTLQPGFFCKACFVPPPSGLLTWQNADIDATLHGETRAYVKHIESLRPAPGDGGHSEEVVNRSFV